MPGFLPVESFSTTPKDGFSTIRQDRVTNSLTKLKATKHNTTIDIIENTVTIKEGALTVLFRREIKTPKTFRTSTFQLLDALTVALTERGTKNRTVSLKLSDYMKLRGLKDQKRAREQVEEDLEILFDAYVSFKGDSSRGRRKKDAPLDFLDMRILEAKGIKGGYFYATFGELFFNGCFSQSLVMPYPAQLWAFNNHKNPNSYALLRKIAELKNMNLGKANEDIIAVRTLLAVAPEIPTYAEVAKGNRNFTDRIIGPFERDMNACNDTFTWEYIREHEPLTDEESQALTYEEFVNLHVRIHWKHYPTRSKAAIKDSETPADETATEKTTQADPAE